MTDAGAETGDWEGGPIIWLASYPKSGNTWVRMLLSAYWNGGTVDINSPKFTIGDLQPRFYQAVSCDPLGVMAGIDKLLVRPAALRLMSSLITQRPLIVKTHNANDVVVDLPLIPQSLTTAAIYIVRDPRDVALSYANHFSCSVDEAIDAMGAETNAIGNCGDEPLQHFLGSWSTHVMTWAQREHPYPVGVVRFEDLITDPVDRFDRLLKYIGFETDRDLVRESVDAASFGRLHAQERTAGFREKKGGSMFFGFGQANRWKNELTDEQARRIEDRHSDVMKRFKYL